MIKRWLEALLERMGYVPKGVGFMQITYYPRDNEVVWLTHKREYSPSEAISAGSPEQFIEMQKHRLTIELINQVAKHIEILEYKNLGCPLVTTIEARIAIIPKKHESQD